MASPAAGATPGMACHLIFEGRTGDGCGTPNPPHPARPVCPGRATVGLIQVLRWAGRGEQCGVGPAARRAMPAARILRASLRRCAAHASTRSGRWRSPQSSGSGVRPPGLPRTHCSPWRQDGAPVAAALLDSGTFSPIQPARPPSISPFRPPLTTIAFE